MEHHHAQFYSDHQSVIIDASLLNSSGLPLLNSTVHDPPGTILGHVIASVSWFTIGFLYTVLAFQRHYTCRQRGSKYISSVEFPVDFLPGSLTNVPVVALIKTVGATTFFISAVVADLEPGSMEEAGQWQHELMSVAFIVSGIIDMVLSSSRARRFIPDGADYLAFFVTFLTELQQLVVHLDSRDAVDGRLHQLMAVTAAAGAISLVAEAVFRRHVMMAAIRGFSIMLQGTWVMNVRDDSSLTLSVFKSVCLIIFVLLVSHLTVFLSLSVSRSLSLSPLYVYVSLSLSLLSSFTLRIKGNCRP